MIKIGNYEIGTQVYRSSDGVTYNFACGKELQRNIESGFATATSVEFDMGEEEVILYAPKLIIEQIKGDEITVLFSASELPVSKQAEYDESIANLTSSQSDSAETIEAISEGLAEIAEIVASLMEGE